jgi:predicted dehydrogenase
MINVGIVGLGFMGMIHYLSYQRIPGIRVAAICELDEKRLTGDWTDIRGNFGPPGTQMDLAGINTTTRLEDLLSDEQLDLIDVTLPPALHKASTVAALAAGKHVFCEKPMSLKLGDCDEMAAAAESHHRQLFVGHVLPFFPEYAWALQVVSSGTYGAIRGGAFRRVISDPAWLKNFWIADQVGGPLMDLHVHDAHFIRLLFGMPQGVSSRGRLRQGLPEFWHSQFDYGATGPTVVATSGTIDQQGRPFNHGFEIHLEQATLLFEFAVVGDAPSYLCPPTILHANGEVQRVELGGGDPIDAFEAELREVAECVREKRSSDVLNSQLARDAVQLCEMQAHSLAASRTQPPAG